MSSFRACALALLLSPTAAGALQCGDVVTTSTALAKDLVCVDFAPALTIKGDGVTLDLNGHEIVVHAGAPGSWATIGVVVLRSREARVVNGRITLFGLGPGGAKVAQGTGVVLRESDGAQVANLSIGGAGRAVSVEGSSDVGVRDSVLWYVDAGVVLSRLPSVGSPAVARPYIAGNRMYGHQQAFSSVQSAFVAAHTESVDGARIEGNWTHEVDRAIHLGHATRLQVLGNDFVHRAGSSLPGIELLASDDALIEANRVEGYRVGLQLRGAAVVANPWRTVLGGQRNVVHGNGFSDVGVGIGIDQSPGFVGWGAVQHNRLHDNLVMNASIGILFGASASHNDGSANQYLHVARPVVDSGTGNVY